METNRTQVHTGSFGDFRFDGEDTASKAFKALEVDGWVVLRDAFSAKETQDVSYQEGMLYNKVVGAILASKFPYAYVYPSQPTTHNDGSWKAGLIASIGAAPYNPNERMRLNILSPSGKQTCKVFVKIGSHKDLKAELGLSEILLNTGDIDVYSYSQDTGPFTVYRCYFLAGDGASLAMVAPTIKDAERVILCGVNSSKGTAQRVKVNDIPLLKWTLQPSA
ncbi:hypothetical protein GP486_002806 [Trichoglossum hirsutum]|uniref:Uncharacterized protein n=1 Tax=Trichoglossum hirsutum TaxID=265104 RepID=A0A9P8LE40_9PEZI|nr:hypothetical protein GP486_002806 [Trichoglossum hirsutum]